MCRAPPGPRTPATCLPYPSWLMHVSESDDQLIASPEIPPHNSLMPRCATTAAASSGDPSGASRLAPPRLLHPSKGGAPHDPIHDPIHGPIPNPDIEPIDAATWWRGEVWESRRWPPNEEFDWITCNDLHFRYKCGAVKLPRTIRQDIPVGTQVAFQCIGQQTEPRRPVATHVVVFPAAVEISLGSLDSSASSGCSRDRDIADTAATARACLHSVYSHIAEENLPPTSGGAAQPAGPPAAAAGTEIPAEIWQLLHQGAQPLNGLPTALTPLLPMSPCSPADVGRQGCARHGHHFLVLFGAPADPGDPLEELPKAASLLAKQTCRRLMEIPACPGL